MSFPPSPKGGAAPDRKSGSGPRPVPEKDESTFFLGRYRVISEIGRGGMASVHLGRVDGPGGFHKWVAIKQVHAHLLDSDQFVDMFLDEARMAAGINHANVAQVFDIGKEGDSYWLVMEYLHGEPLRELMRYQEEVVKRPVSPLVAARIAADAAEGLHAAHELKSKTGQPVSLVHRDVTPHNLFITYEGYTKVVDFGIARATGRLATTSHGQLKGKIAYMSPEQVRNLEIDRRTDIYALGIVLWELSTNQRLFRMENDLDTLERVFDGVVPKPSSVLPGYPPELEDIVLTALAQKKEERYQTARDFSRALHRYLAHNNSFVGWEDVATVLREGFTNELKKREQHLAWASDVTNTRHAPASMFGAGRPSRQGRAEARGRASEPVKKPREDLFDEEDPTVAREGDPFSVDLKAKRPNVPVQRNKIADDLIATRQETRTPTPAQAHQQPQPRAIPKAAVEEDDTSETDTETVVVDRKSMPMPAPPMRPATRPPPLARTSTPPPKPAAVARPQQASDGGGEEPTQVFKSGDSVAAPNPAARPSVPADDGRKRTLPPPLPSRSTTESGRPRATTSTRSAPPPLPSRSSVPAPAPVAVPPPPAMPAIAPASPSPASRPADDVMSHEPLPQVATIPIVPQTRPLFQDSTVKLALDDKEPAPTAPPLPPLQEPMRALPAAPFGATTQLSVNNDEARRRRLLMGLLVVMVVLLLVLIVVYLRVRR